MLLCDRAHNCSRCIGQPGYLFALVAELLLDWLVFHHWSSWVSLLLRESVAARFCLSIYFTWAWMPAYLFMPVWKFVYENTLFDFYIFYIKTIKKKTVSENTRFKETFLFLRIYISKNTISHFIAEMLFAGLHFRATRILACVSILCVSVV